MILNSTFPACPASNRTPKPKASQLTKMSEQDIVPLRLLDLEMRIQKLADKLDAVALSVRNISDELSVMQDKLTAFEERIKIYLEPDTCHMQEIFGMGSIWEESSPAASPEFPNA